MKNEGQTTQLHSSWRAVLNLTVLVVSLGYFVDIFDLTLFNMVRRQSLLDLGISEIELVSCGLILLNTQMAGMLIGGIFWGQLGDRRGRLGTLFGSIVLYSLANLLNAGVTSYEAYLALRFAAGFGLAGELGIGITLVAELLPRESRGWGTMTVATIGVLGAVVGGLCVEFLSWRGCYVVGGLLGLLLLGLRMSMRESHIFGSVKADPSIRRGQFLDLLRTRHRIRRLVVCTLIGLPFWYIAGIVMAFTPELGKELSVSGAILSSRAVAISYLGLGFGDFLSGWLSQVLQSRKRALVIFHSACVLSLIALFTTVGGRGTTYFYSLCFVVGIAAGFWALFVTVAAESFGTNLRSTAATSIPNFVRAAVLPMTAILFPLREHYGFLNAVLIVGALVFGIASFGLIFLEETFHRSLEFTESTT